MALAAILSLFLVLAAPIVYAADHVVGGNTGWSTSGDYSTWASSQTFRVGDNLLFSYGSTHSVNEVSEADYTSCTTTSVLNKYSGGQNTIPLTKTGSMYFICPTIGHCGQGMKLSINVIAASTTPATPTPPSTTPGSNTPPTKPTNSSPPPAHSAAVGTYYNMNQLMLVVSLVLALVITVMV